MATLNFPGKDAPKQENESVDTVVTTTKLIVQPHRGAYSHCASIEAKPTGVVKPPHCTVHAVYHVTLNDNEPKLLCPQCTTQLEHIHTPELFDQDV